MKSMNNGDSHAASRADTLDSPTMQSGMFPPPPAVTTTNRSSGQGYDMMRSVQQGGDHMMNDFGPAPANSALAGGSFW